MTKLVLAIVVLAALAFQEGTSDVIHVAGARSNRQYLPPQEQYLPKQPQYKQQAVLYKSVKAKGIGDPPLVRYERQRTSPSDRPRSSVGPRSQLFTPVGQATQHRPIYTNAPHSTFHTQINVQSQASKFSAPNSARQANYRPQTAAFAPFSTGRNENQDQDLDSDEAPNEEVPSESPNGEKPNGKPTYRPAFRSIDQGQQRLANRPQSYDRDAIVQRRVERPISIGSYRANNGLNQRPGGHYFQPMNTYSDDGTHNGRNRYTPTYTDGGTGPQDESTTTTYVGSRLRNGNDTPSSFAERNDGAAERDDNNVGGARDSSAATSPRHHGQHRLHQRTGNSVSKGDVDATRGAGRQRPEQRNYQGINLIDGDVIGEGRALANRPATSYNGNSQGVNIINGNLHGNGRTSDVDFDAASSSLSTELSAFTGRHLHKKPLNLPSANAFEVVYKPGDSLALFESTSSEFGDANTFVDTAASSAVETTHGRRSGVLSNVSNLSDDGYHYDKPNIRFRT